MITDRVLIGQQTAFQESAKNDQNQFSFTTVKAASFLL